jgi:hypothetical protein
VSESRNYGDTWECFQGSSSPGCFNNTTGSKTRIDSDSTYQDCVGPTRTIPVGQPNAGRRTRSVNDSRPAVGIHAAAETIWADALVTDQHWYFALGKSVSGKQRIHLWLPTRPAARTASPPAWTSTSMNRAVSNSRCR